MSDVIRDVDHNIRYEEFDATTQADPPRSLMCGVPAA
jgi:hypothetical protein